MSADTALMVRDDARMAVQFTPAAIELRDNALATSALVGKVTNADEQVIAVGAQALLHSVTSAVEKARKECKEPAIEFGRRIDGAAKKFVAEIKDEETRIAALVGSFQQLEQARVRAEEAARNEKLLALEREKAQAMAKATSHEAMDAIAEHYNAKAADIPVAAPARVEGQRVVQDWEIVVTDAWLLARAHPACVEIVPRILEIKNLLKAGVKPAGVQATPISRSSVRGGSQKVIDV